MMWYFAVFYDVLWYFVVCGIGVVLVFGVVFWWYMGDCILRYFVVICGIGTVFLWYWIGMFSVFCGIERYCF